MDLPLSLGVSLAATLALEWVFALMWGVGRRDLPLVALVNLLTNPVVVLGYSLCAQQAPELLMGAALCLEAGAVAAEGWLYQRHNEIRFPWAFSLCANLFSYTVGLLL